MVREFIEGWDLLQILGEGTFAEVKLLVNRLESQFRFSLSCSKPTFSSSFRETGEACAMKEIRLDIYPDARESVKKEICVHKLLRHQNIVQCYGSRIDNERQFIFLEYCTGGELFDRIGEDGRKSNDETPPDLQLLISFPEPEVGMPEHLCQSFFLQLIDAIVSDASNLASFSQPRSSVIFKGKKRSSPRFQAFIPLPVHRALFVYVFAATAHLLPEHSSPLREQVFPPLSPAEADPGAREQRR